MKRIFTITILIPASSFLPTNLPAAPIVNVDMNQTYEASITADSGDHHVGDLYATGQNTTDDQIGIWDNGSATSNWWNYCGRSATDLMDADGRATGISYVTNLGHVGSASNWTGGAPNDDLLPDGAYGGSQTSLNAIISGLTGGTEYDIVVYHADDYPSENVTVNGAFPVNYTGPLARPDYADAHDGISGSDLWYFEGVLADGEGQLEIISAGSGWDTISGFQLELPEPTVAFLLILAALVLLPRRPAAINTL